MPKGKSKPKAKAKKHARHSARSMRINANANADDRASVRERTSPRTDTGHVTSPSSPPKDAKDANENNDPTTADNILGTDTADAVQTPDRQVLLSPKSTPLGGTLATSPTIVTTPVDDSPSVSDQDPFGSINLTELHAQGLDHLQRLQSDYDRALDHRKRARDAFKQAVNKADRDVNDPWEILHDHERVVGDRERAVDEYERAIDDLESTVETKDRLVDIYACMVESYECVVEDWELAKAQHNRVQNDLDATQNGTTDLLDDLSVLQTLLELNGKRQLVDSHRAVLRETSMVRSVFTTAIDAGKRAMGVYGETKRIFVATQGVLGTLRELAEAD